MSNSGLNQMIISYHARTEKEADKASIWHLNFCIWRWVVIIKKKESWVGYRTQKQLFGLQLRVSAAVYPFGPTQTFFVHIHHNCSYLHKTFSHYSQSKTSQKSH